MKSTRRSSAASRLGLVLLLGCGLPGCDAEVPARRGVAPPVRVAFVGDLGLGPRAHRVLKLVASERADLLVVLGDLDYESKPDKWRALLRETIGETPWLAAPGNHDLPAWPAYQRLIRDQIAAAGMRCRGEVGVKYSCRYRGIEFALVAPGLLAAQYDLFLREQLRASPSLWRVCGWHLTQADMQLGSKPDDTGYGVYRACQSAGAMIVTAHEHSYSRTFTLTDVGNSAAGHGATGAWNALSLGPGRTFVSVVGAGGASLRGYRAELHDDDTWWAAAYTLDRNIANGERRAVDNQHDLSGVLIVEFGSDGDPARARGEFKTIGGAVPDSYRILADAGAEGG